MKLTHLFLLGSSILALTSCDPVSDTQTAFDKVKLWVVQHFFADDPLIDLSAYMPQDLLRPEQTVSGSYLSSRFAQNIGDWTSAEKYVQDILDLSPDNVDFERKAMVLAMGAGHYSDAFQYARKLVAANDAGSLSYLILTLQSFKDGNVEQTLRQLRGVPQDGVGVFIAPLIEGWTGALNKQLLINNLNKNPVHLYHAVLIADYLNDKATIATLARNDFAGMGLSASSLIKLQNIFKKYDLKFDALRIQEKLSAYKVDISANLLTEQPVTSPQTGLAQALYDMGSMLYSSYGDSSRIFAQMALYLNPTHIESRILLAQMAADAGHSDEAIMMYQKIDTEGKPQLSIRIEREIAALLEKEGKTDLAIRVLKSLVAETKDIESQIQIGDLYRRHDDFSNALKEYNTAASMIGNPIAQKQWQLLYARGMTYERLKEWDKAEADLQAALKLQPDHPYILNYLGYSWADQGVNLPEAAKLIERAAALEPSDGYIVDSLGWVCYRMKDYTRAVKYLERAVELMPNDPTINDHLGDAYWQMNRRNEARFQWKRALSFNPDKDQRKSLEDKIENGLGDKKTSFIPSLNASDDQTASNDE